MKILLIGGNKICAIERFYVKYLKENGVEIIHYPANDIVFDNHSKNIFNKILFKTKINTGYTVVNKKILSLTEEFQPDIIWVFKGMEIFPETLKKLKGKHKLVNYNPDNPFVFTGKGSGNSNITNSIGLYDLHFTYNKEIEKELKNKYHNIKVEYLPFGYDLNGFDITKEIEKEVISPCFVGNPDHERADFIKELNKNGISFHLYGNGWDKFVSTKENVVSNAVTGLNYWKILRKYRVQLNLMRIHNPHSHNMRTFEIAPVGGIQLMPRNEEHLSFYKEDIEAFFYENIDEAVTKIKYILSLTKDNADSIRNAAIIRAIESRYSYENRVLQVLKIFNEMLNYSVR